MPEKIEVKTGKPSDATCISWIYQPNELERAKATATEFFDNVTRIWTTEREKESKNRPKERDMERANKYTYYKVLQSNSGYGWDDEVLYNKSDKEQLKELKEDRKAYKAEGIRTRVIERRELN